MARGKVFVCVLAKSTGESYQMLEASGCRLVLGQAGSTLRMGIARTTAASWPKGAKPSAKGTAVGQEGDTHVTLSPEVHRGKWPGE